MRLDRRPAGCRNRVSTSSGNQPVTSVRQSASPIGGPHAYPAERPGAMGLRASCGAGSAPATRRVTVTITGRGNWDSKHRVVDPAGHRGHGLTVTSGCVAETQILRSGSGSGSGTTVTLISRDVPATVVSPDGDPARSCITAPCSRSSPCNLSGEGTCGALGASGSGSESVSQQRLPGLHRSIAATPRPAPVWRRCRRRRLTLRPWAGIRCRRYRWHRAVHAWRPSAPPCLSAPTPERNGCRDTGVA
jgi:hypothetical protein